MTNFYWVNGSGNWNDSANHWSASSGGAPGAGVPTSTDDCFFDANSFTSGSKTVTFNVSPDVKSMDFTGATDNPSVAPNNSATIRGSLTLISGMNWGNAGSSLTFDTTSTTVNLTTAGVTIGQANLVITGSGTFNFQDTTTVNNSSGSGAIKPSGSATINLNNHNVNALVWQAQGSSTSTINLGSSTVTLSGSGGSINAWVAQSGETINASTSTIVLSGSTVNFVGAGKTYYDVSFTGSPITITGNNTFNSLTIAAGKTVNFPASGTQTITTLNAVGTSGNKILFRSSTNGTQTSLCVTTWNIAYVDMKDINASCATATNCTGVDSGHNTGIDFCTGRAFLLNLV